jgi:hypothetical protein
MVVTFYWMRITGWRRRDSADCLIGIAKKTPMGGFPKLEGAGGVD